MKLGISSFTFGWAAGIKNGSSWRPLTPYDLLGKAKTLGVKVVQIGDNMPLHQISEENLITIEEYTSKEEIEFEVGTKGLTEEMLSKYIPLAHRMGSPILRVVIDESTYRPSEEKIISIIKEFEPELKKKNVILAIENHDRFKAKNLAEIIDCIGSNYVGICLDTSNSLGAGEGIEHVVNVLGPITVNLHIKDIVTKRANHLMGFVIEGRPAGQGDINIPWVIEKMKTYNRNPNVIIEQWTPPEITTQKTIKKEKLWAEESVQYLRGLISE